MLTDLKMATGYDWITELPDWRTAQGVTLDALLAVTRGYTLAGEQWGIIFGWPPGRKNGGPYIIPDCDHSLTAVNLPMPADSRWLVSFSDPAAAKVQIEVGALKTPMLIGQLYPTMCRSWMAMQQGELEGTIRDEG